MRIIAARLQYYGPFADTQWVRFEPGINIVLGQNNAGKSAFMRSFYPALANDPHRSAENFEPQRLEDPRMDIQLGISGRELTDALLLAGNAYIASEQGKPFELKDDDTEFKYVLNRHANQRWAPTNNPPHGAFAEPTSLTTHLVKDNGKLKIVNVNVSNPDTTVQAIDSYLGRKLFVFDAQRLMVGACPISATRDRLLPNASNLPIIIWHLWSGKGDKFRRLCEYTRSIFPSVQGISVSQGAPETTVKIVLWPTKAQSDPALGVDLDNSGTGVSQVIAILTVVLTFNSSIIVIDELSAFLHPSALKALLRILRTYHSDHQYIISAHSLDVIGTSSPNTVSMIRRSGYNSTVEAVDFKDISQLRDAANHLGVSMADVFSADYIIWVEGPTEEECFPYLYQQAVGELPPGLFITPVIATGDFSATKVRTELVFQIYEQLSKLSGKLVKSVVFSLDREMLTEDQVRRLEEQSKGRLYFLPRRNFECFLLSAKAIWGVLAAIDHDAKMELTEAIVLQKLQEVGRQDKFGGPKDWNGNVTDPDWLRLVDGAGILKTVFSDLTETRVQFDKKRHCLLLLKSTWASDRQSLDELVQYLRHVVSAATSSGRVPDAS